VLPLERAAKLRKVADDVLGLIGLPDILQTYGTVYPTGSYFLDTMVYPDIDLYMPKVTVSQLFDIGAKIAACDQVTQVVFQRTDDPINLPDGLYLKSRLIYGDWGRPWKIDLWSLSDSVIQARMAPMLHFQEKMTTELREQIILYKLSVMTAQKRTPVYSGYYIYKAFIDEGLTDFADVTRYLISNGIQVLVSAE
jgi:hypothetical protein